MVHKTGYLLKNDGERYIQVETIFVFYRQAFVSAGKHLLFEEETYMGNFTVLDGAYTFKGSTVLTEGQKAELIAYLKDLKPPVFDAQPSQFGFGIELDGNLTYCEVILSNDLYEIWYDGKLVAKLYQDEWFTWIQASGEPLPPSVVGEITGRIETITVAKVTRYLVLIKISCNLSAKTRNTEKSVNPRSTSK